MRSFFLFEYIPIKRNYIHVEAIFKMLSQVYRLAFDIAKYNDLYLYLFNNITYHYDIIQRNSQYNTVANEFIQKNQIESIVHGLRHPSIHHHISDNIICIYRKYEEAI